MNVTYQPYRYYRTFFFVALLTGCSCFAFGVSAHPMDSIGVEIENGQKIIIHRLKAKETYFGLSRQYNIPVKNIITSNNNKPLKVGDTVRIPTTSSTTNVLATTTAATTSPQPAPALAPQEYTTYKVSKGETLYTISKRFVISIESIKRANELVNDTLKEGTLLKIPHKELPPPPPTLNEIMVSDEAVGDTIATENIMDVPTNKYGIREMTEKGVGVWIDDLNQEGGSMLALHKTAPIGTIVKITNPMTNRTTLTKVVGKFADTAETKNAIIVISKSAASLIGVLDRRFQVEISYGTPNESHQ